MPVKIIAEIGINHNGSIETAKKLIDVAVISGCDYVKFQKRRPDICVPDHQKDQKKHTPWGIIPYLEYKKKIEFEKPEYDQIDKYCAEKNIGWFASVWDIDSVDFMSQYTNIIKVPSALLTNNELGIYARKNSQLLMLSTGMSDESNIDVAVKKYDPDVIFHTNSTYPCPVDELNLNYIKTLMKKFPDKIIGYSGHEFGLVSTFAAVAFGAKYIERHITLERTMWGSDQMASVEPGGLIKLVKGIRDMERAFGSGSPRKVMKGELEKLKSLRG